MKNKFLLFAILFFGIIGLSSCQKDIDDNDNTTGTDFSVAERQLISDYPQYVITDVQWDVKESYQVGTFVKKTKSTSQSISVWYKVEDEKAERQVDIESQGTTVPDIIKSAFEATPYSDANVWRIEDIELENRYNDTAQEQVYEMELDNITNTQLEAELYFDAKTGKLLFTKEELDSDDNSDDIYIVNTELEQAVKDVYPNAIIIDASKDDGEIEVDIIVKEGSANFEIEMLFSLTYNYISSEYEVEYSNLPAKFVAVNTWFETPSNGYPIPASTDEVEVIEGLDLMIDNIQCNTYIEIEYETNGEEDEYEVSFYLDADNKIYKVKSDNEKDFNYEVEYSDLPAKFAAVNTWFETSSNGYPIPASTDEVEITEGSYLIIDNINCKSYVEIEYEINGQENDYKVSFYLDANGEIIEVHYAGGDIEVGKYTNGTFVLNQGNMSDGRGSLVFIDSNGNSTENANELENNSRFPSLAQDMYIYNNHIYIIFQTGDLIVLNAHTLKIEKKYDYSDLGLRSTIPTNLAVIEDDVFIRSSDGFSANAHIYKFNLKNEETTVIEGNGSEYVSKNRMTVIGNTLYASSGSRVLIVKKGSNTAEVINIDGGYQYLSLISSEDGNLWLSGGNPNTGANAIMKINTTTNQIEINPISYDVVVNTRDHPMIGAIGNDIYFQYGQKIIYHDFLNKDPETNTKVIYEDFHSLTGYKGLPYNGIGVDREAKKIYINTIKSFSSYRVNDILVFDIKSKDILEFNTKYKNKTRFPNGFHFTFEFAI